MALSCAEGNRGAGRVPKDYRARDADQAANARPQGAQALAVTATAILSSLPSPMPPPPPSFSPHFPPSCRHRHRRSLLTSLPLWTRSRTPSMLTASPLSCVGRATSSCTSKFSSRWPKKSGTRRGRCSRRCPPPTAASCPPPAAGLHGRHQSRSCSAVQSQALPRPPKPLVAEDEAHTAKVRNTANLCVLVDAVRQIRTVGRDRTDKGMCARHLPQHA